MKLLSRPATAPGRLWSGPPRRRAPSCPPKPGAPGNQARSTPGPRRRTRPCVSGWRTEGVFAPPIAAFLTALGRPWRAHRTSPKRWCWCFATGVDLIGGQFCCVRYEVPSDLSQAALLTDRNGWLVEGHATADRHEVALAGHCRLLRGIEQRGVSVVDHDLPPVDAARGVTPFCERLGLLGNSASSPGLMVLPASLNTAMLMVLEPTPRTEEAPPGPGSHILPTPGHTPLVVTLDANVATRRRRRARSSTRVRRMSRRKRLSPQRSAAPTFEA